MSTSALFKTYLKQGEMKHFFLILLNNCIYCSIRRLNLLFCARFYTQAYVCN